MHDLEKILSLSEGEHIEFKEAKNTFDYDRLSQYCAALANEGGGLLVLGVTDEKPRKIVGTKAYEGDLDKVTHILLMNLHLRVALEEHRTDQGRVLIFDVPSRPMGMAVGFRGAYWVRAGSHLAPMSQDQLKRIFAEATPDFSAGICPGLALSDLDESGIERFRGLWIKKSGRQNLANLSSEQVLVDAELMNPAGVTYAALILFGTSAAVTKHLTQAEVIFEYRNTDASGPASQRLEFRRGIFLFLDELWATINLRNEVQHFRDGLMVWDIPTFNEIVIREGILNALAHRDYRLGGSIFVRQYPRRLEIVNPGGFPDGVTLENILWQQSPRNRRIAETLTKCGLVERSGQGVNLMFDESIKESKAQPDFSKSDAHQVFLRLNGSIRDPRFLKVLQRIGEETLASFSTDDLLILDYAHQGLPVPPHLKDRVANLKEHGIVESTGKGKGARLILSRKFQSFLGKRGEYTRKKGLDRETNKQLLLKHIRDNQETGSQLKELSQVLPTLSRGQLQVLLKELREQDALIEPRGKTNSARWFPKS